MNQITAARVVPILAIVAGISFLAINAPTGAKELTVKAPPPALVAPVGGQIETAIFAGGCFWGVEAVFEHVRGVVRVDSGYSGGNAATARYPLVTTGRTGHAEAVKVIFNPARVNYAELLRVYFSVAHDPTQLNRQGPDVGPQYRSALFPLSADQARVARAYIAQLSNARIYPRPIVTKIEQFRVFYPAESYHQDFMAKNPSHPYIQAHDAPKLVALKAKFPQMFKG